MQPVYVRYAHKAQKLDIDLGTARDKVLIAYDCVAVTILNKGAGTFTLEFKFFDDTILELDQDEVLSGDVYQWDIKELRLTNTAQTGQTLKLLIDIQVSE